MNDWKSSRNLINRSSLFSLRALATIDILHSAPSLLSTLGSERLWKTKFSLLFSPCVSLSCLHTVKAFCFVSVSQQREREKEKVHEAKVIIAFLTRTTSLCQPLVAAVGGCGKHHLQVDVPAADCIELRRYPKSKAPGYRLCYSPGNCHPSKTFASTPSTPPPHHQHHPSCSCRWHLPFSPFYFTFISCGNSFSRGDYNVVIIRVEIMFTNVRVWQSELL